jgi:protein transport protein SEC61 subunit gamma-like protein
VITSEKKSTASQAPEVDIMGMEAKANAAQGKLESKFSNIGKGKYGRILRLCHTPSADEYKKTLGIVTIGLLILGIVGYAIYWVMSYLPGYF